VELANAVGNSISSNKLPEEFHVLWERVDVDAATPLPTKKSESTCVGWEAEEGWVSSNDGWDIWVGNVGHESMNWKPPPTSSDHRLMDGGEGPPMLRPGSIVMRGVDWDQSTRGNDDGKDKYDSEKAQREKEKTAENKESSEPAKIKHKHLPVCAMTDLSTKAR